MSRALAAPPLPPIPPLINTWAAPAIAIPIAIAIAVLVFVLVNRARAGIRNPNDFLLAGRKIGVGQNTMAMVTGPIMYSTMFIIVGQVTLKGYDGLILLTAFTFSMLTALVVYASPVRNLGGHTVGDLFALRARERPARSAAAFVTLLIYIMFMIATLDAIGMVSDRLLGFSSTTGQALVVGIVGLLAIVYVYIGGLRGVTSMLMVKAVLVIAFILLLTVWVLAKYKLNVFHLLDDANAKSVPDPRGYSLLDTGRLFDKGSTYNSDQDPWVHISKVFSIVAGVAGFPYLFMRNFVATSGRAARRSSGFASMIIVGFYLCISFLGLAAVAIVGGKNLGFVPPQRDITFPKLTDDLGGQWASGVFGAIGLLVVGSVFAALLISMVTSFTKDFGVVRGRRQLDPAAELKDIRRNVLIIGVISLIVGIAMLDQLTHIFIPTSIDLAGAAILPSIVYSLFWRRFNTRGLMWTVYGGIAVTLAMVVFSNGVSGDPAAMFPNSDFKIFDIEPGLVSVPVAFLLGFIGSITSSERDDSRFAEMQVRALTGAVLPARKDALTDSADESDRPDRTDRTASEAR